ncbi:thioredoxin family protein [Gaetbulibacter aestuarii]|uniref:Thioredoxin fold domain-containing protein n=1 Tax=Gaetbulibacter aestuarii TaxID=1502358 RepID=A0ABW7N443_9FLAO
MRKILFTLLFFAFLSTTVSAQEINWVSLEQALELQKKEPKKIMMDAYTNWCGPCKMLDKNTFHNPDVVAYVNKNYYAVKFNAEGNEAITYNGKNYANPNYDPALANRRNSPHELSRYLRISAYPTIVFMDETGNVIAPIVGYQKPTQLELYLKLFKTDDYKSITSQDQFTEYYNKFKPEFQN